jgi:hypothetical protein
MPYGQSFCRLYFFFTDMDALPGNGFPQGNNIDRKATHIPAFVRRTLTGDDLNGEALTEGKCTLL